MSSTQQRLNVNINKQTSEALRSYSQQQGITVTEAVRRLVNVGHFIAQAQGEGKKIQLADNDGVESVHFSY